MKKTTIYLADLCHHQFGLARSSISLGIGTIASYLIKKLDKEIHPELFTTYEDLIDKCKKKEPDIIGLANFGWNENLNVKTMSVLRRDFPNVLIITGGANISPNGATDFSARKKLPSLAEAFCVKQDLQILAKMPQSDYFIHADGEMPVYALVKEFIKHDCSRERMINEKVTAPGCSLVYKNELIFGGPPQRLRNLDDFDSPYKLGLYDEILDKYDLVPQIETDRGCPYECGFCTIGGWTNSVIKHSLDWVKKEILDLKERSKIKILRVANSNFGLLKQDIEIAKFIKDTRDKEGYPNGMRVYSAARGANDRVKNLMRHLGDMLPLNLSFQSLTGEALSNVARINQGDDVIQDMSLFARDKNLMLSTEIILGLPGETYETFLNNYTQLFKYGFESVIYSPLALIRGSDLYTDEARKKYKFKTRYVLIERSVSEIEGELYFEYDESPVESNSYDETQYWNMHMASIFVYMTLRGGYYKEFYRHALNSNITFEDIFLEIKNNSKDYPEFSKTLDHCLNSVKKHFFHSVEDLRNALAKEIKLNGSPDNIDIYQEHQVAAGKLLTHEYRKKFINEFTKAITKIYASRDGNINDEFCEITKELKIFTESAIISPQELPEERLTHNSYYDIEKWLFEDCALPLSTYKMKSKKNIILKVRNYSEHQNLDVVTKNWDEKRRCLFYFRQVVSSNHRRIVERFPITSSYQNFSTINPVQSKI